MDFSPNEIALVFLKLRLILGLTLFVEIFLVIYEFRKLRDFLTGKLTDLSLLKKVYLYLKLVMAPVFIAFIVYSYPFYCFAFSNDARACLENVTSYSRQVNESATESPFFKQFPKLGKSITTKIRKLRLNKVFSESKIVDFNQDDINEISKLFNLFAKKVEKIKLSSLAFPEKIPSNIDLLSVQPKVVRMHKYLKIFTVLTKYLVSQKKYNAALKVIKMSALLGLTFVDGKASNISYYINNLIINSVIRNTGKSMITFSKHIALTKEKINLTIDFFQRIIKMYPQKTDYHRVLLSGMLNPKFFPREYFRKEITVIKEHYNSDFSNINGPYVSTYKTVEEISNKVCKKIEFPGPFGKGIFIMLLNPNKFFSDLTIAVMGLPFDKTSHNTFFHNRQYFNGSLVVMAIYNYKHKFQQYPESIATLEKWLGRKLPIDQFSGQILHYKSNPLTLTSVGPDLKLNTKDDVCLIPLYKKK